MLSTCNRTELYVVVSNPVEAETTVLGMLARQAGLRPTELIDGIYAYRNCDAARHLYRVASGLESMIVGEAEVQGQVKRAYEAALAARTTGPLTNKLFRAALATGKRVRTETAIGAGGASVASVAVDAARVALGELASRHVLIIGAGETAELTARALSEQGVATMFVANRRRERATALARRFGGSTISFDELPGELERADIVVASTASPHASSARRSSPLVTAARGGRPLLLLDLAVPRDIDPACARSPASRWSTSTGCRRRSTHALRAPDRGAPCRGHRRGGDPGLRRLARDARGAADDRRAARAGRRVVAQLLAENEEALGEPRRARPRARRGDAARGRQAPAARADAARCSARQRAPARSLSLLRELFGLDEPAGGGPRARYTSSGLSLPCSPESSELRLGTRGSALALAQARWVAERCRERSRSWRSPLPATCGPTRATSRAGPARSSGRSSAGEIDLAVHSAKDVPGELADGTEIVAVPPRADPRDVLVGAASLDELENGARVGTSALRRRAQLLRCARTSTSSSCAATSTRACQAGGW